MEQVDKQEYKAPRLARLGDVAELTKAASVWSTDGISIAKVGSFPK